MIGTQLDQYPASYRDLQTELQAHFVALGLDWWRYDRDLSPGAARAALSEQEDLRAELRQLRQRVEALTVAQKQNSKRAVARRRR